MLVSYENIFIPELMTQLETNKLCDPPVTEPRSKFLLTFQYFSQVLFLFWDFRQEYFGIKMTHFVRRQNTACTWCWSVKSPFDINRLLNIQKHSIKVFISINFCTSVHKWHTCPWVFSLVLCSTKQNKTEHNINLPLQDPAWLPLLSVNMEKSGSADLLITTTHREGSISHRYGHIHTVCLWQYVGECKGISSKSQRRVCLRKYSLCLKPKTLQPSKKDRAFIWRKVSDRLPRNLGITFNNQNLRQYWKISPFYSS